MVDGEGEGEERAAPLLRSREVHQVVGRGFRHDVQADPSDNAPRLARAKTRVSSAGSTRSATGKLIAQR